MSEKEGIYAAEGGKSSKKGRIREETCDGMKRPGKGDAAKRSVPLPVCIFE